MIISHAHLAAFIRKNMPIRASPPVLGRHPRKGRGSITMKMADGVTMLRRNRPGTKAKVRHCPCSGCALTVRIVPQDFSRWPDEPFEEMDSTLVVQQFIQQQICHDPANVAQILTPPEGQDEGVWKYEHLR